MRRLGLFSLFATAVLVVGWFVLQRVDPGPWSFPLWAMMFVIAACVMGDGILTWFNHATGDLGEERLIKKLELLDDEYTVITNWLPPGGKRGDVDIIILGPHGVAALECKKYTTEFGCDGDFWFQKMENGYKKRWKSLSSQTRGHAQCIKRHLKRQGVTAEVHAALCFSSLSRATIANPKVKVIEYGDAVDFIYSLPRTGAVAAEHFVQS